jgi:hypothetical protein
VRKNREGEKFIFIAPGLGSFSPVMMRNLIKKDNFLRQRDDRMEKALSEIGLYGIEDVILGDKKPRWLSKLQHEMVSTYIWTTLIAKRVISRLPQDYLLVGYSLGELTCGTVCGTILEKDVLMLILEVGTAIEETAPKVITYFCNTTITSLRKATKDTSNQEALLCGIGEHIGVCTADFYNRALASQAKSNLIMASIGVDYGFHTSFIEPAKDRILKEIIFPKTRKGTKSWYSCAEGSLKYTLTTKDFWRIMRKPLNLDRIKYHLGGSNVVKVIEIGPTTLFRNISGFCKLSENSNYVRLIEINDINGEFSIEENISRAIDNIGTER